HAGFECQAGAQGGLLEEHHHLLAGENTTEIPRPLLEHGGQVEERENLGGGEVVDRDEIARCDRFRQQIRRVRLREVRHCHSFGSHLRFPTLHFRKILTRFEPAYDNSRIRRASACACFLSVVITSTVSSPAIVPTTSGQCDASSAAATGCALPTVVFTTSRFCA